MDNIEKIDEIIADFFKSKKFIKTIDDEEVGYIQFQVYLEQFKKIKELLTTNLYEIKKLHELFIS